MARKILTLCLVRDGDRVLLGMKKRGFGAGRWNGFGGKIEGDETIEAAARRELQEEAGIEAVDLKSVGICEFIHAPDEPVFEVHVFETKRFSGEPKETEEMRPQWFSLDEIPFDQMFPDDRFWFPVYWAGQKFRGVFQFDKVGGNLVSHSIETV